MCFTTIKVCTSALTGTVCYAVGGCAKGKRDVQVQTCKQVPFAAFDNVTCSSAKYDL